MVFCELERSSSEAELLPKKLTASSRTASMSSKLSMGDCDGDVCVEGRLVAGRGKSGGEDGGVVRWTLKTGTTFFAVKRDIINGKIE